jgi:hypothetical protein
MPNLTQAVANTNISNFTASGVLCTFDITWPGTNLLQLACLSPLGLLIPAQLTGTLRPGDTLAMTYFNPATMLNQTVSTFVCTAAQVLSSLTTTLCYTAISPAPTVLIPPRTPITYTPAVAGTGTFGTVTTNGAQAANSTTLSLSGTTLTGIIRPGDAITIAGNIYYAISTVTAAGNAAIFSIFPAIPQAGIAGGTTATYAAATAGTAAALTFQAAQACPVQYIEFAQRQAGAISNNNYYKQVDQFTATQYDFSSDNSR